MNTRASRVSTTELGDGVDSVPNTVRGVKILYSVAYKGVEAEGRRSADQEVLFDGVNL